MFGDKAIGFQVMSLAFGLLFALSVLLTGLFAKEEIQTPVITTKLSFKEMAKPLSLHPFRQYLCMFFVLQMSMAIMSGLFFFYVDFHITKFSTFISWPTMVGLIAVALMFSMQIVALSVYIKMIEKKGKSYSYRFGAYLWIVTAHSIFTIIILVIVSPLAIYISGILMGFGISSPGLVPHTMYGDVIDTGQIKFKDCLEGQMSGFTNFFN
jgi:Na+/melibiose symporter-like transporter